MLSTRMTEDKRKFDRAQRARGTLASGDDDTLLSDVTAQLGVALATVRKIGASRLCCAVERGR